MLARVLLGPVALAIALSTGGCFSDYRYLATDGTEWPGGAVFEEKPASWVIVRSAKHDIPCDDAVIAAQGSLEHDWVVQGCGQRVTYRFFAWAGHAWQPALVSRIAMQ